MITDRLLRTSATTTDEDVITGTWVIDPERSRVLLRPRLAARLSNVEGIVHVTASELTISAVFDVEHPDEARALDAWPGGSSASTFPSGTLRARTILWSGGDGLAMGELSLHAIARPSALDVAVVGYAVDRFGAERARVALETEVAAGAHGLDRTESRLRLHLELVRGPAGPRALHDAELDD